MTSPNSTPKLELLWSQEFDSPQGASPDLTFWSYQIGDGTDYGIPGWGNQELEYYTDTQATMDGEGNLVLHAVKNSQDAQDFMCYYGPAQWLSSRLATAGKLTFKYGRIEARIKAPTGGGSWPALWMLGTDIEQNPWPQCGEIDIIELRGNAPREVIGTVHGPDYFGDNGNGTSLWLDADVADEFHTFTIDWLPDSITWYFDGRKYFALTAADVAPKEWVFNHEFYLLLNLAVGGGFAGEVDPDLTSTQLVVDWIRHYSIDGVGESLTH
ncbi:MAG: hypothetical protein RIS75_621 [Actinomycetota bacterium]